MEKKKPDPIVQTNAKNTIDKKKIWLIIGIVGSLLSAAFIIPVVNSYTPKAKKEAAPVAQAPVVKPADTIGETPENFGKTETESTSPMLEGITDDDYKTPSRPSASTPVQIPQKKSGVVYAQEPQSAPQKQGNPTVRLSSGMGGAQSEGNSGRQSAQFAIGYVDSGTQSTADKIKEAVSDAASLGFDGNALVAAAKVQNATEAQKQNGQDEKSQFMASQAGDTSSVFNTAALVPSINPDRELKAGCMIPIVLETMINSDLPGMVRARVVQNVYDSITGQNLLIPAGSIALATYDSQVMFGQDRVLVSWNRVIRPDGLSIMISGSPGTDTQGQAGYKDLVDYHYKDIMAAIAATSTFDYAVNTATAATATVFGSLGASISSQANSAASKVAEEITTKILNRQPTIIIRAGTQGRIFISRDIVIPPDQDASFQ